MKIAIIQVWPVTYTGAERVLEQLLNIFPEAYLYTPVDFKTADQRGFIHNKHLKTSFIKKILRTRTIYRQCLPLMPLAIEQHNLSSPIQPPWGANFKAASYGRGFFT